MKSVPSENILQLRELSNKICSKNQYDEQHKSVIIEMKRLVEESKRQIDVSTKQKDKLKYYEKMCVAITNLLQKIK
jgi:predicted S18 family serine protease